MFKRIMTCLLPIILLLSFFDCPAFFYGNTISCVLIAVLFLGQVLSRIKDREKIFNLTKMDLIIALFIICSLLTTVFADNFPLTLIWFTRILAAWCLYKLSGELELKKVFKALIITGTAASLIGIIGFNFVKAQGLVIPFAIFAQLAVILGLFQGTSEEWELRDRIKHFLFAFTNFLYLLFSSSGLVGFTVLITLFLQLFLSGKTGLRLNFMRVVGALSCALVVNVPISIIPGLGVRIGCYLAGLGLSLIIVRLFNYFLKQEKGEPLFFYLSIFLSLTLASAFITFMAANNWLERISLDKLLTLGAERISIFNPLIIKNNLSILGTGQGFAYPATNSFTSLWIQQGMLGFAAFSFLLVFLFIVIIKQVWREWRSTEQKITSPALPGLLVIIIPVLFLDLTTCFPVIYLGAVFCGALQLFPPINREGKINLVLLISVRIAALFGMTFLIAVQCISAAEIHYANSGNRYLILGKVLEARQCFEKALKFNPRNWDYYYKLALTAQQSGDNDLALDYVREAMAFNPGDKDLYVMAGNLHLKQGDLAGAEKYYLKVTDAYEFYFVRYENLAASYLAKAQELIKKGQRQEAEQCLAKIKEIYVKMEEAYNRVKDKQYDRYEFEVSPRMKFIMSKCYYYLRDFEESEKWARKCMQHPETRSSGIEILYFIRDQLEAGN